MVSLHVLRAHTANSEDFRIVCMLNAVDVANVSVLAHFANLGRLAQISTSTHRQPRCGTPASDHFPRRLCIRSIGMDFAIEQSL
jgi:hypothetical protein